ncbi:type IV pilin [Halorhabdus rudnickae]|uniref:type IV pilin n=1 Tax=Halorhabdus rudnickae TaxID=1775544 RepID=UPI0014385840|nr:type IV pilin N-terminal domain-containing protein [Halorhabdus rudnickae]
MVLKRLEGNDERGLSPVISVILMVAITVILAAVIAGFVMNKGPSNSGPDRVEFRYENSTGWLSITHDGGEALKLSEYRVVVDMGAFTRDAMMDEHYSGDTMTAGDQWNIDYTGTASPSDSHLGSTLNAGSIEEVRIVWEPPDSDRTQVIDTWTP